jgi:hypothetical protein
LEPYVIRQGEYLLQLAHRFGFDADTVWMDDMNADLRKARPNPNVLCPTDVLYIPDQANQEPAQHPLDMGSTNTFVADVPTTTVRVQFTDDALASQPCTVAELPDQTSLATDGGLLTLVVPVDLDRATVTFSGPGVQCVLLIGHLDPPGTVTGVLHRLQNLGYLADSIPDEEADPFVFGSSLYEVAAANGASTCPTNDDTQDPSTAPADGAGTPAIQVTSAATSTALLTSHGC